MKGYAAKCGRKRVRFSKLSLLLLMEPKTSEEVHATWYTRKELAEFRRNGRMALKVERKIAELRRRLIAQDGSPRPTCTRRISS
jgi:hypothetical protein